MSSVRFDSLTRARVRIDRAITAVIVGLAGVFAAIVTVNLPR